MRKVMRIIVSPLLLASCIAGYWLIMFIAIMLLIGGAMQYMTGEDDSDAIDSIKMGLEVMVSPIVITWKWIQTPAEMWKW